MMIPMVQWRKIGEVSIFELQGIFTSPWVDRAKEEILEMIKECPTRGLLLNLKQVEKIDSEGAEAILEMVRRKTRCAILGRNLATYFVAERMKAAEEIPIFNEEKDAIAYFEKEFVSSGKDAFMERRRFPRLKTAVPVEVFLEDYDGPRPCFKAVVTNLTPVGVHCYFLDAETENQARRTLDPFDFKTLRLHLHLTAKTTLEIPGKLLRTEEDDSRALGIAVEFYSLNSEEKNQIQFFLKNKKENQKGAHKHEPCD